jgi:predicted NBD/HSP70 family sugar kinase
MTQFRIEFDIGGTKLAAALLGADGALVAKERWPVPENYPDLLASSAGFTRPTASWRLGKDFVF